MNRIKDFIYDYNDVVVALLIIALTAGVVVWRVRDIMGYPSFLAKQKAETKQGTEIDMSDVNLEKEEVIEGNDNPENLEGDWENTQGQQGEAQGETQTEDPAPQSDVKFTVKSGEYAKTVAENLKKAGLISDVDAFLKKMGDKATKIKARTFTIPAGSTDEQIIEIIIK